MRATALAVAAGVVTLLAHAPTDAWPLAFGVLPLLLEAVRRAPGAAGRLGLLAGLVTNLLMLRWLVLPAGYLAWGLLSLVTAAWLALFARLVRPFVAPEDGPTWPLLVVAPVAWVGIEFLRTHHPFSGFGWATLDLPHVAGSPLLPLGRVLGGGGLSLVTAAVGTAAWFAIVARDTGRRRWGGVTAALVLAAALLVRPGAPATRGTVAVVAVQGNPFVVSTLTARGEDLAIVQHLADETGRALRRGPADLVLWPEYAIDRDPATADGAALAPVVGDAAAAVAAQGGTLVAGVRREAPGASRFRNTVVALPPTRAALTDVVALDAAPTYTKRRPVPFGEYVPFRHLLGGYPPLAAQVPRDAAPGVAATLPVDDGVHAAVLVCFETIYRDLTLDNLDATPDGAPAGLVLAVTNDASYGISHESAQHVAQTAMRAVETGRWTVHGALSGSSALVAPDGRIVAATDLFTVDHLRADVPVAVGRTTFMVLGDLVGNGTAAATAGLVAWRLVAAVRRRTGTR